MRALPLNIGPLHFVGIGGIGMSGIAEVLHNLGYRVQGSDLADGANVRRLIDLGIPVAVGHDAGQSGRRRGRRDFLRGRMPTTRKSLPRARAGCRSYGAPKCWAS